MRESASGKSSKELWPLAASLGSEMVLDLEERKYQREMRWGLGDLYLKGSGQRQGHLWVPHLSGSKC